MPIDTDNLHPSTLSVKVNAPAPVDFHDREASVVESKNVSISIPTSLGVGTVCKSQLN